MPSELRNTRISETVNLTDLKQKKVQMGNNLAEQQVNNNNQAKTKQQTQEQFSSPLSQVLKTYDFGNFVNCELNIGITFDLSSSPSSHVPNV